MIRNRFSVRVQFWPMDDLGGICGTKVIGLGEPCSVADGTPEFTADR